MRKTLVTALISLILILILCSCASILEGDMLTIEPHQATGSNISNSDDDSVDISSYDELRLALLEMIDDHKEQANFNLYIFDDTDVASKVEQICFDTAYHDSLGAYSVYYINSIVNQIVSYYEVSISINYRHSKTQIDSIVTAHSQRYLYSKLHDTLASYCKYIVFSTNLSMVTEDYISSAVAEIYRDNPLSIVALPVATVNIYSSESDEEKVVELSLDYHPYTSAMLASMDTGLNHAVQEIVDSVGDNSDASMLLSLCRSLIKHTSPAPAPDVGQDPAETNIHSTAYGALVNASATSEGYALAYKSLCDKLGLDCQVVVGKLNGEDHAWNIVRIDGDYYHVDTFMCDANGISTAFLKRDSDIINEYWWDIENYEQCSGYLTYYSIVNSSSAEPDPDLPPENTPDNNGDTSTTSSPSDSGQDNEESQNETD